MVTIQGQTVIARPVEEVFDFVADERNEPKSNRRMIRAEKLTSGPVGLGTRWTATIAARGRPIDMTIDVTDDHRPHRLGSVTRMSTAAFTVRWRPNATPPGRGCGGPGTCSPMAYSGC